ncbi:acyl carrier protein [Sneathiella sp. P13V-1]|uniref:acyl carrier protein n=1 Tax=Sneathiella sp. P13V-1 TaxID=2697366 RepID=UPI00187BA3FF|nr:acyl carrier protein [Sneathiella sp. P13V-1]MBE7636521.1 acyl carrier protein [Sneathiella sp. P13V-1]
MTRDEIEAKLNEFLVELFEVDEALITPDALLAEDLDLDSIDAVDLIVNFQDLIGKKVHADDFKSVRTVNDVVDQIHNVVTKG